MEKIDFYIISAAEQEESFICRLINKIYQKKRECFVWVASNEEATRWDKLLWSFEEGSFIPHLIYNQHTATKEAPIYIGTSLGTHHTDVLVNLTENMPPLSENQVFSRVIEIVAPNETQKAQSRMKYKYYQQKQCPLQIHNL